MIWGIRVGDYLVQVGGREVKTSQDVRDAVRETSENGETISSGVEC